METEGILLPKLTEDGVQVVTQTFVSTPQVAVWKQRKHVAIAGQTNFFDIQITTEIQLSGGEYIMTQAQFETIHPDDYIEFSIVDKDDVLGLFETYNLEPGDVLELFKFIRNEYPERTQLFESPLGCTFKVYTGLYLRFAYVNAGTSDVNIRTRFLWYE